MKLLVYLALLSVLVYPAIIGIPLKSDSSDSAESSEESDVGSNESVYVIKEVSYEIGTVDTLDLGNSTQVLVNPQDRVETEGITLWSPNNGSPVENENSTNPAPTEVPLPATAAAPTGPQEVNKETTGPQEENKETTGPQEENKETTGPQEENKETTGSTDIATTAASSQNGNEEVNKKTMPTTTNETH